MIRQAEAHANDGVPSLGPVDRASLHDSVVERLAELIFDGPLEIGKGRRPLVAAPA